MKVVFYRVLIFIAHSAICETSSSMLDVDHKHIMKASPDEHSNSLGARELPNPPLIAFYVTQIFIFV